MVIGYSDGSAYESSSHELAGVPLIPKDPDYDMQGFQDSGKEQADNGHYPDDYKLPNHITFSDQSLYHGQDGEEGGHWARSDDERWAFTPGPSNYKYHTHAEMVDYFKKYEPGNVLNAEVQSQENKMPFVKYLDIGERGKPAEVLNSMRKDGYSKEYSTDIVNSALRYSLEGQGYTPKETQKIIEGLPGY